LLLAANVGALYRLSSRSAADAATPAVQSFIDFPNSRLFLPSLSPDGRYLSMAALPGTGQEGQSILIRRLADGRATWLAGTEHAYHLAWSPDSRSLAVLAGDQIKAIDIATGGIRTLGRSPEGRVAYNGSWNADNLLLGGSRLRRLSVADGRVTDVYRVDPGVSFQNFPSFLPDGRRFLFSQESNDPARRGVFLGMLDSPHVTRLLPEPATAIVSPRGCVLYGRQGSLFAQGFDLESNRLTGDPVSIGTGLGGIGPSTAVALSGNTLVWANDTAMPPARIVWFDRNGGKLNEIREVRRYTQIALAPDAQRAVAEGDDTRGLVLLELTRNTYTRLTTGDDLESDAVWSPDSREVAFSGSGGGIFKRRIDQSGRTALLDAQVTGVEDWTRDGRFLIFAFTPQSVWALPLNGDRKHIPLIESSSAVDEPHVSHDGRWLAYSSNDTGQWEVYVQPFMRRSGRVRVSTGGGSQPRWRADGKELFYLALDGAMMSVDTRDPASPATPQKLFETQIGVSPVDDQYDVTADGQRFLVIVPEGQQATRLTVLTNWPSLLAGQ
jgi:Tol biopolymer transport system component